MTDKKVLGLVLLLLGLVVAVAGLVFFIPFGWTLVLVGVIMIVYGRDYRAGVDGTFMEHLSGKKFREHKISKKK